jgi:hypothetical protein
VACGTAVSDSGAPTPGGSLRRPIIRACSGPLEALAWHPDYFRRAILVLARRAAIDSGGRLANRPANSL